MFLQINFLPVAVSALGFGFALGFPPWFALACSACYGQSDSAMAKGMNWGILSLLGVVVTVLGGIAAFFVFLADVPPMWHGNSNSFEFFTSNYD